MLSLLLDDGSAAPVVSFWQLAVLTAVGGGSIGLAGGGLVTWLVKKLVNSLVDENRQLTRAVTDQVKASTEAMGALTRQVDARTKVEDERFDRMVSQLDRIEAKAAKR